MIEYVLPHNPDDRVLKKASEFLNSGELICFPTDTSWILAACSEQKNGIEKLYQIKKEGHDKHFSLLCNDISMASELAHIDNNAFKIIKRLIPGHYTFIFEASKKISKFVQASKTDKEVGVRFVPLELVNKIITYHGKALVSTNIPKTITPDEEIYSYQLEEVLMGKVKMIIDPGEYEFAGPSSIIQFHEDNSIEVLREGVGDTSIF